MNRRSALTMLISVTAGCAGLSSSEDNTNSTPNEGTDTKENTETTPEPFPEIKKPDENCETYELPTANYPSLPESVNEQSVKEFALEFEKAYSSANMDSQEDMNLNGFDGSAVEIRERSENGILARATVHIDYTEQNGQSTVAGSDTSHGWYYVTPKFAVRARGDGTNDIPTRGWVTISCGESTEEST